MELLFVLLAVWLLFAGITATIAQRKGLNPTLWMVIGLFFGLLAVAAVLLQRSGDRLERVVAFELDTGERLEIVRSHTGMLLARLSVDGQEVVDALTRREAAQVESGGRKLPESAAQAIYDRLRDSIGNEPRDVWSGRKPARRRRRAKM